MNIIAVVVLYKCRPDRSPTIASMVRSWEHCPDCGLDLKLIIYDNSPEPQKVSVPLPFDHQYVHDGANGGLAAAYNHALNSDWGGQHQWLLLLDQDSELPANFIAVAGATLEEIGPDPGVAAAVPQVVQEGRPISPAWVKRGGRIRPIRHPARGICQGEATAVNSGVLVRKQFLAEVGGFDKRFLLDYLDHWLFAEINRRGRKVYVTEAVISHDLSIGNAARPVSTERYRSVLMAETLYFRVSKNRGDYIFHLLNLAARAARQFLLGNRALSGLTWRHLYSLTAYDRFQ